MDWYWYVLIGAGVIGLGVLKVVTWNRIKANKSGKHGETKHPDED